MHRTPTPPPAIRVKPSPRTAPLDGLSALLALTALLLPLLYIPGLRDAAALPRYTLIAVAGFIGVVILLTTTWRRDTRWSFPRILIPLLLVFIWSGLSTAWSADPDNSLVALTHLGTILVVFFLALQLPGDTALRTVLISAVTGASLVAIIGLMQYFGLNPGYHQFIPPASTFTNKNFAALYLDLIVPVSFSLVLLADTRTGKLLATLALSLCLSYLVLTRTRGSWLGLLAGITALAILLLRQPALRTHFRLKKRGRWLIAALAVLVFLSLMPNQVFRPGYKINALLKLHEDGSIRTRLNADRNALVMIKHHPLAGSGFGSFPFAYRPYMFVAAPTFQANEGNIMLRLHNDPLQTIVELGIPVGLLAIGLFGAFLWMGWRYLGADASGAQGLMMLGLWLGMIVSTTHSLASFPLHKPAATMTLWLWGGFITLLYHRRYPRWLHHWRPNRPWLIVFTLLTLAYGAGITRFYGNYLRANHDLKLALTAIRQGHCTIAQSAIDRSMALYGRDILSKMTFVSIYSDCPAPDGVKLRAMNYGLTLDPTDIQALLTRAALYARHGMLAQATADYRSVTRILPNRASGFLGLGDIARLQHRPAQARRYFRHALDLEPRNPLAHQRLEQPTPPPR